MSTQTKSKLYILIIGILLVTNIAMLFFFWGDKRDNGRNNKRNNDPSAMMKNFLKKDVGFNDQQVQQYDTLSKQHREKMKAQFDSLKTNKEQQFKELGSKGFNDSAIVEMANRSSEKQKLMELQMLNYFATVRKICTPEQQPKFDSLFYKIWSKKKKPDEKK
jgi:Spy/CpxP family protein refolding chaperone